MGPGDIPMGRPGVGFGLGVAVAPDQGRIGELGMRVPWCVGDIVHL
jgi:hypothetical protein